jgi:hypothetical protein
MKGYEKGTAMTIGEILDHIATEHEVLIDRTTLLHIMSEDGRIKPCIAITSSISNLQCQKRKKKKRMTSTPMCSSNSAREWPSRMCSWAIFPTRTTTAPHLDGDPDHAAATVLKVEAVNKISLILISDLFNLAI